MIIPRNNTVYRIYHTFFENESESLTHQSCVQTKKGSHGPTGNGSPKPCAGFLGWKGVSWFALAPPATSPPSPHYSPPPAPKRYVPWSWEGARGTRISAILAHQSGQAATKDSFPRQTFPLSSAGGASFCSCSRRSLGWAAPLLSEQQKFLRSSLG